jgi:sulfoquinovosidase
MTDATVPRRARLRRGAVIAAVVLVGIVGALRLAGPPPTAAIPPAPVGTIEVGDRARGTYEVGQHTIVLGTQGLTVSHPRSLAEVYASPPGRAFVTAARGEGTIAGPYGVLRVADRWDHRFEVQTVDGADVDADGRLVISGTLADEEGAERLDYQVFIGVEAPSATLSMTMRVLGEVDRVSLVAARGLDERVLGLGAQFTDADLRGRAYPIVARRPGVGRGGQPVSLGLDLLAGTAGSADTTPAPLPFLVTSVPRSMWVVDADVVVVDLRGQQSTVVTAWGDRMEVRAGVGRQPEDHVSAHARATGLMRSLPAWVDDGVVVGSSGPRDQVRQDVVALRDAGVPIAALWLADRGVEQPSAPGHLPRAVSAGAADGADAELRAVLDDLDVRLLATAVPALVPGDVRYDEAAEQGFLLQHPDGGPYVQDHGGGAAVLVDLLDPDARDWYADVLAEDVLVPGVSGFAAELGDTMPVDGVSVVPDASRADYPTAWAVTTRLALQRAGLADEGLVWHTAAGPGTAGEVQLVAAGQQLVDLSPADGLPSAVDGMLAGGLSGLARSHLDIGGHTTIALPGLLPDVSRTAETHMRSAEVAAFTALMRTQPGNRPDLGVQATDPAIADHLADMASLHRALADERQRLESAVVLMGVPLVRHPLLVVPEQPEIVDQQRVFFLGEDLFVAPVVQAGQTTQAVRLPVGRWVHIWSGDVVDVDRAGEGAVTVDAPIGQPPAWARDGSPVADELAGWREGR